MSFTGILRKVTMPNANGRRCLPATMMDPVLPLIGVAKTDPNVNFWLSEHTEK